VTIAFGGAAVVALGSPVESGVASSPWLGNGLALLGAVFMSGYLLLGRKLAGNLPTSCYVASVYTVAAATLWIGVYLSGAPKYGFSTHQWLLLVAMALIPQGLGHTLLNVSVRVLPTTLVAMAILGEPVLSSLLAIPLLGEVPNTWQLLGGALVIFGVMLGGYKS
jgi:drug/metabolite transporter (DMT)-like permease